MLRCTQRGGLAVARGLLRMEMVPVSLWGGRKRLVLAELPRGLGGTGLPQANKRWTAGSSGEGGGAVQREEVGGGCCVCLCALRTHVYSSTCLSPASAAALKSSDAPGLAAGSGEPFAAPHGHGRAVRAGSCRPGFSRADEQSSPPAPEGSPCLGRSLIRLCHVLLSNKAPKS